ncbi:MAG: tetraacyldisaccharide 4'-kinase, partial [Dongiaceae bacterium]
MSHRRVRAPEFWARDGILPALLSPLAGLYVLAGDWCRAAARPYRAPVPVICAGAVTAGGAGDAPLAQALAPRLSARG